MLRFVAAVRLFTRDSSGATAIEYSLLAALIALVIIAALSMTASSLNNKFSQVSGNLT